MTKRMTVDLGATSTARLERIKAEIDAELAARRTRVDLTALLWGDHPSWPRRRRAKVTRPVV